MSELLEYKCPNCGGSVEFDSELQKLQCPYCDAEFEVAELDALNEELAGETQENMAWEASDTTFTDEEQNGLKSYICNSCGGEIVTDATTLATACPFCDNPVMMKENMTGILRPDYVIPFKLDRDAAKAKFHEHLKGKVLLPSLFKTEAHIDEIKGVYVPFWLFGGDAEASVRFRATRTARWSDSRYIYTRTSHYSLFRAGGVSFERVPVDGSEKMPDNLMESLEPYTFTDALDFNSAYLAGYFADKYDVPVDTCMLRANERIKSSVEDVFRETVPPMYAGVRVENNNTSMRNGVSKYALYPVWLLNTTYKGKKHIFAMNGQTGKFVGDLPVDKKKASLWWLGLFAAASAAVYGIASLLALLM